MNISIGSAAYEPTVNEVQVPVLNRELCNDWLVQLNVTEGMICAGYSEGGKDACQVNIIIFNQNNTCIHKYFININAKQLEYNVPNMDRRAN